MSDNTTAPEATEAQAPANNQSAELTVTDLGTLKQIIDVASQRGALKPNEMQTIGAAYSKLEAFLAAVTQQQSQNQEVPKETEGA